jgi:hypothetical protein
MVLALDGRGNLNDVFHDIFDYLLYGIRHVDLAHLLDRHPHDLVVCDRNVIRHFDTFFDVSLDRIGGRVVYVASDLVRNGNLAGNGGRHGGGHGHVSLNDLLNDLFDWVGYRLVDDSLDRHRYIHGNSDVHRPGDLDYFFHELLHRIGNLSLANMFDGVRNPLLDNLLNRNRDLDWHWNGHSSWNSCVSLYNLFDRNRDWPVNELLNRHRNIDIADSFDWNSNGPLYELLHRIRNINAVRNGNFVRLRIRSVDRSSHRNGNGSRECFLNWNGNRMVDVSVDRIRNRDAGGYIYGVRHVHAVFDISIDRNGDLSVNIPLYRNGCGPLHHQCPSPRKRHR